MASELTSTMKDDLMDYSKIAAQVKLPDLTWGALNTTRDMIRGQQAAQELTKILIDFSATQGWCHFQSGLCWRRHDSCHGRIDEAMNENHGRLLFGEMTREDGQSLHVWPLEIGGWGIVKFGDGSDEEAMIQDHSVLSEEDELARLRYKVYWCWSDEGYKRQAAQFVGFGTQGGE